MNNNLLITSHPHLAAVPARQAYHMNKILTTILLASASIIHSQSFFDPLDSSTTSSYEFNLDKLIYIEIHIDSAPQNTKGKFGMRELTLPHCADVIFDKSLSRIRTDVKNLNFTEDGSIEDVFVILNYQGNMKTFSQGGDNIDFKKISSDGNLKINAAFDTSFVGYEIKAKEENDRNDVFSYMVNGFNFTESHKISIKRNITVSVERFRGCD